MILSNFLIGFIEDNTWFFTFPRLLPGLSGCTDYYGYPSGICENLYRNNQPFAFIPSFLLAKFTNSVFSYNFMILIGFALTFFLAYRFYKKLFGRFIAAVLSTIFLASPYFAYHSRSHLDLVQFWPVILFLDTLFFFKSRYKPFYLGLLLTLITGFSNYLGYFTILLAIVYKISYIATSNNRRITVKNTFINTLKASLVFSLLSLVFLFPYIKSSYFPAKAVPDDTHSVKVVKKPIEDFIIFSSRPWYYLLPTTDNPFFGSLTENILGQLASGKHYLTQNYFKAEHSVSYLGWVNLMLAFIGIIRCQGDRVRKKQLLMTICGLFVLTMPPVFTWAGASIYTPSYLLFKSFGIFRVLSRMGVLILFLILIFTGYGYSILVKHKTKKLVLVLLAMLSLAEFFIPLKLTHVDTPPEVYLHLRQTDHLKSAITVYPYNKTNDAVFWIDTHQKPLINPRYYENSTTQFKSQEFTKLLSTNIGLEKARSLGAKYLVYFYEGDQNRSREVFDNSSLLTQVKEFRETGPEERVFDLMGITLIRIVEAGSAGSNSAILYKFK